MTVLSTTEKVDAETGATPTTPTTPNNWKQLETTRLEKVSARSYAAASAYC